MGKREIILTFSPEPYPFAFYPLPDLLSLWLPINFQRI